MPSAPLAGFSSASSSRSHPNAALRNSSSFPSSSGASSPPLESRREREALRAQRAERRRRIVADAMEVIARGENLHVADDDSHLLLALPPLPFAASSASRSSSNRITTASEAREGGAGDNVCTSEVTAASSAGGGRREEEVEGGAKGEEGVVVSSHACDAHDESGVVQHQRALAASSSTPSPQPQRGATEDAVDEAVFPTNHRHCDLNHRSSSDLLAFDVDPFGNSHGDAADRRAQQHQYCPAQEDCPPMTHHNHHHQQQRGAVEDESSGYSLLTAAAASSSCASRNSPFRQQQQLQQEEEGSATPRHQHRDDVGNGLTDDASHNKLSPPPRKVHDATMATTSSTTPSVPQGAPTFTSNMSCDATAAAAHPAQATTAAASIDNKESNSVKAVVGGARPLSPLSESIILPVRVPIFSPTIPTSTLDLTASAMLGDGLHLPPLSPSPSSSPSPPKMMLSHYTLAEGVRTIYPHTLLSGGEGFGGLVRVPRITTTALISFGMGILACWAMYVGSGGRVGGEGLLAGALHDASSGSCNRAAPSAAGVVSSLLPRGPLAVGLVGLVAKFKQHIMRRLSMKRILLLKVLRLFNVLVVLLWFRKFLRSRTVSIAYPLSSLVNRACSPFGVAMASKAVVTVADSQSGTHAPQPFNFMPFIPSTSPSPAASSSIAASSLLKPYPEASYSGSCMVVDVSDLIEQQWGRSGVSESEVGGMVRGALGVAGGADNNGDIGNEKLLPSPSPSSASLWAGPRQTGEALAITADIIRSALAVAGGGIGGVGRGERQCDGLATPAAQLSTLISGIDLKHNGLRQPLSSPPPSACFEGGDDDGRGKHLQPWEGRHQSPSTASQGNTDACRNNNRHHHSSNHDGVAAEDADDDSDQHADVVDYSLVTRILFITRRGRKDRHPLPASSRSLINRGGLLLAETDAFFRGFGMKEYVAGRQEEERPTTKSKPVTASVANGDGKKDFAPHPSHSAFAAKRYFPPYTREGHSTSFFTAEAAALLLSLMPRLVLVGTDAVSVSHPCPSRVMSLMRGSHNPQQTHAQQKGFNCRDGPASSFPSSSAAVVMCPSLHEGALGVFHRQREGVAVSRGGGGAGGVATIACLEVEPIVRVTNGGMAIAAMRYLSDGSADLNAKRRNHVNVGAVAAPPAAAANINAEDEEDEGSRQHIRDRVMTGSMFTVFCEMKNFADARGCSVFFSPNFDD